jgi:hypothetical protein
MEAQMADGDPLIVGNANVGTSNTSLTTNVQGNALFVENTGIGTNSAIYAKYVNPQAAGVGFKIHFSKKLAKRTSFGYLIVEPR